MTERREAPLVISVPWPIRLFGDFQYFLGLPAIVAAVDLRTAVSATPRADDRSYVKTPWLAEPIPVDIHDDTLEEPSLRRVLRALAAKGMVPEGGYDFLVVSRVPWPGVLSNSAALAAAWTVSLLELGGRLSAMSGNDVAALVARAFEDEQPSARPIPEIYGAVLGGTLQVGHGSPPDVMTFERNVPGLLTCKLPALPRERKQTSDTALRVLGALAEVVKICPDFDVRNSVLDDILPKMSEMEGRISTIAYAELVMRDLCRSAHRVLENEHGFDDDRLGEMLDGEHEMLRDYLGYNNPKIESILQTAVGGGALGGKILPESYGFVLFAPSREDEVAKTIREAGAEAHVTPVSDGMRVERIRKVNTSG
jgi:galactokinase